MSGSLALAADLLSDAERTDVRRFCGYPAYGAGNSGFQSWRFFASYGVLEFRLTNLAPAELQVVRQYLANLYTLEAAIPAASDNLDTASAAVYVHNKDELLDRAALFAMWRQQLVSFLGVPFGPTGAASTSIVI